MNHHRRQPDERSEEEFKRRTALPVTVVDLRQLFRANGWRSFSHRDPRGQFYRDYLLETPVTVRF
jgi:hypothetical protein